MLPAERGGGECSPGYAYGLRARSYSRGILFHGSTLPAGLIRCTMTFAGQAVNVLPVIVPHTVRFPTAAGRAGFPFANHVSHEAGIIADQAPGTVPGTAIPPAGRAGFPPVYRIAHEPGAMADRAPGTIRAAWMRFPPAFNAYLPWTVVPGPAVRTEPHNRDLDAAG